MKKYLLPLTLLLMFIAGRAQEQQTITTIILVRHAEKEFDEGGDPELTAEGEARAKRLAEVLHDVDIDAVYSTPFKRTRLTVTPLASDRSLEVQNYNPFKLEDVMDIINNNKGKTLVFSGHSNTTPLVLNMLVDEDRYRQLAETDCDNLYIVSYLEKGKARVLQLQYGAPSEE